MYLFSLLINNIPNIFIVIVAFILSILPIFPPVTVGFNEEYWDFNQKKMIKQRKLTFLEALPIILSNTLLKWFVLQIGFRGTVTLILFILLGADLYFNKSITSNAVTISIIAIVALYLEKILDGADEISIWKIFTWKSKKGGSIPEQQAQSYNNTELDTLKHPKSK